MQSYSHARLGPVPIVLDFVSTSCSRYKRLLGGLERRFLDFRLATAQVPVQQRSCESPQGRP